MYEEKKAKEFKFMGHEKNTKLSQDEVSKILEKFSLKCENNQSGYLTIDKYTNNTDSSIDYDLNLKVYTDTTFSKADNFPLKTSCDIKSITTKYNQILEIISQN